MIDAKIIDKVFQPIADLFAPTSCFRLAQFFVDGYGLLRLLEFVIEQANSRALGWPAFDLAGGLLVWWFGRRFVHRIGQTAGHGLNPYRYGLMPMRIGMIWVNMLDWIVFFCLSDWHYATRASEWAFLMIATYFASCHQAPPVFMFRKKPA